MSEISIEEINAMLTARLEDLVRELLPAARKQGHEFCVGSLAGEKGQSLRINCSSGARRGVWRDFSGHEGGDPLKLVCLVNFGGDYKRAVPWAKSWLGLDNADPARIETQRRQAAAANAARERLEAEDREKRRRRAEALWLEARPLERGDPVDRYLRSRAIDLGELGHAPGTLRHHPALGYYVPRPEGGFELRATLPAMVAHINSIEGKVIGVHRTWLKPDGSGKAGEAELGRDHRGRPCDAKKVLGSWQEGHIKLWLGRTPEGARIKGPLRAMPGKRLHLSEGIEDGLTAAVADPRIVVAAMVTIGNMPIMPLPEQASEIVMLRQNDPAGSRAAETYEQGVQRMRGEGRRVLEIALGEGSKDINELAQEARRTRAFGEA